MSDVIGTNIKCKSTLILDNTKANSCSAQEQEVNDLSDFVKLEYEKYSQYKLIYDSIKECINKENHLDEDLKNKIKNILLSEECSQTTNIDVNVSDKNCSQLFAGVKNNTELNYSEGDKLKEVLEVKINGNFKQISSNYASNSTNESSTKNTLPFQLTPEDATLIEYKQKLTREQEQYVNNLITQQKLLNELVNLRLKTLPKLTEQKIRECNALSCVNNLKSDITQKKFRLDIFMETNKSLEAYKELIKDIKEQQTDCLREIEDLQDLQEKYKQVSCKQYDDILKSYLQYKSNIEKKKLLYGCLKG